MTLLETINNRFVQARRDRNKDVADCLKMVKSRISLYKASPSFSGELTDEVVQQVIASYVKEVRKALNEIEHGGAQDSDIARKYRFEVEYLSEFLPSLMDARETEDVVRKVIAEVGALTRRDKGKVMSAIMRKYKGRIDPKLATEVCDSLLS